MLFVFSGFLASQNVLLEKSFHSGRHAFATFAKDGGAEDEDTSRNLGHSSTKITKDVYIEYQPQEHFGVVDHVNIEITKPTEK